MAEIQLSPQLLNEMHETVVRHHPGADASMVLQYLAAIMGYSLASQAQFGIEQQRQFLEDLCEFARSVHSDVSAEQQQAQQSAPPAGQSAFGIWEPGS